MTMSSNHYLALNKTALLIFGSWPLNFESQSAHLRLLYRVYEIFCKIWLAYVTIFVTTQWIQMYSIPFTNLEEIVQNISTNLVYSIGIYQLAVCKQKKAAHIITNIYEMEREVLESNHCKHLEIYQYYTKLIHTVCKYFVIMSAFTVSLIVFLPLVEMLLMTESQTRLPLSSWFPFDKNSHYAVAYVLQGIGGYSGCAFVVVSDIFIFAIMIFAIGQFKILQQQIIHFKDGNNSEIKEINALRICINKHKLIIK